MKGVLLVSLPLVLLAGCTTVIEPTVKPTTSTSVNGVDVTSVVYQCSSEPNSETASSKLKSHFLVEHFSKDKVMLVTREASYPLIRIQAASGEKYASTDGAEEFWSKGDSAMIKINDQDYKQCTAKPNN
ncbi:lysozyme inhibitor [Vibrio sp. S11_S32]|uniref:MliC family protein n=1 Tax=Vibrio sp. S11_S32 TaxID=2720225 RepID=UPI001680956A|nr:MliC family protein [Vibrio sp. S11_S32]MBD1575120.1 lysozyme inhibitor [Vibrio sp. S11_S32]